MSLQISCQCESHAVNQILFMFIGSVKMRKTVVPHIYQMAWVCVNERVTFLSCQNSIYYVCCLHRFHVSTFLHYWDNRGEEIMNRYGWTIGSV